MGLIGLTYGAAVDWSFHWQLHKVPTADTSSSEEVNLAVSNLNLSGLKRILWLIAEVTGSGAEHSHILSMTFATSTQWTSPDVPVAIFPFVLAPIGQFQRCCEI